MKLQPLPNTLSLPFRKVFNYGRCAPKTVRFVQDSPNRLVLSGTVYSLSSTQRRKFKRDASDYTEFLTT